MLALPAPVWGTGLANLIPAVLAVLSLAIGARDVAVTSVRDRPTITFKGLGMPFLTFLPIVGLFDLGNSSDAFLALRAQERCLSVTGILMALWRPTTRTSNQDHPAAQS